MPGESVRRWRENVAPNGKVSTGAARTFALTHNRFKPIVNPYSNVFPAGCSSSYNFGCFYFGFVAAVFMPAAACYAALFFCCLPAGLCRLFLASQPRLHGVMQVKAQ